MAWTAPRTWVVAEIVTATQLNQQIRSNLNETMAARAVAGDDLFIASGASAFSRLARSGTVGDLLRVSAGSVGYGAPPPEMPAGAICFFDGAACPGGWTAVAAAIGRAIVGLPSPGTLAATVGTALGDGATRTITIVPSHSHAVGTYGVDPTSVGAHTHNVSRYTADTAANARNPGFELSTTTFDMNTSNVLHSHSVTGSSETVGVASVDVTMPYIQYLVCRKD